MLNHNKVNKELTVVGGFPYPLEYFEKNYGTGFGISVTRAFNQQNTKVADCPEVNEKIATPFALATITEQQDKKALDAMVKAGWKILRWGWSNHAKYKIFLLGKKFPTKLATATAPPNNSFYWDGSLGCGVSTLTLMTGTSGGGGRQKEKLAVAIERNLKFSADDIKALKAKGWARIRGSNIMIYGGHPKEL